MVSDEKWSDITDPRRKIPAARIGDITHATKTKSATYCGIEVERNELLIFLQKPEGITCEECKRLSPEYEWQQMIDSVVGKTIKAVENWAGCGPTFVFTDGSSLELYGQPGSVAWVLENEKRPEAER